MSAGTEDYDDTKATELATVDVSHWWYRSKAALIATGDDQTSPAIDAAARALTSAEWVLLGRASLPIGSSVLYVATRGRR
jgi:hypothetical protein